jgi:cell division protein ZipA
MSELRWTLLILGVVFIAALSWWERRRPRQAFAPRLREGSLGHGHERTDEAASGSAKRVSAPPITNGTAHPREPWIGDTELSDAVLSEAALSGAAEEDGQGGDDPVRTHVEASVPGPLEELPTLVIPDEEEQGALRAAWEETLPEPKLIDPEGGAGSTGEPEPEIAGAEGVGAVRIVEPAAEIEPIVDWPPEESRRIVALRLVAAQPERFPGRALRLALAAEGFLLGKFSIFHKPDESNRAVLSAASLTSPGAFDLETMDLQRFAGLSLFAVLPGPKTGPQAFEDLLATARNLNERLQGALQDERGGPLTPLRVAGIRESLRAEAVDPPASAAHET